MSSEQNIDTEGPFERFKQRGAVLEVRWPSPTNDKTCTAARAAQLMTALSVVKKPRDS